jgi:hypothetical protein
MELVFFETYPSGTTDFSGILNKVKAAAPFAATSLNITSASASAVCTACASRSGGYPPAKVAASRYQGIG